jgi:glycosyltransferase involved in cell wall biosynthesis
MSPSSGGGADPLRVLMVSSLWPPYALGGAEMYAANLAARLAEAGHSVGAVTLGIPGPDVVGHVRAWPYRLDEYGTQPPHRRAVFHALDVYRLSSRRVLADAFRRFRPDVVHTHSVQGLSSAALQMPTSSGLPHVHTIHDYWLLCQRASLVGRDGTACIRRCRPCAAISTARNLVIGRHPPDVVIAVSDAVAREHSGLDWLTPRLRIVHNPVEFAPPKPRPVRTPVTFGYLGQVTAVKGVKTLLDAVQRAAIPGSRLVIAGEGPLRQSPEATAGMAVEFRGFIDADGREAFFAEIDCLVVPSEWKDPAPLVVNEARARGVPVIGADIGGIPEIEAPGCAPLLFPSGDTDALAARLQAFASSPGDYFYDSRAGLLDWNAHIDRVCESYRDAIRAKADRQRIEKTG